MQAQSFTKDTGERRTIVVPLERVSRYADLGWTYVGEWYGGTVILRSPR